MGTTQHNEHFDFHWYTRFDFTPRQQRFFWPVLRTGVYLTCMGVNQSAEAPFKTNQVQYREYTTHANRQKQLRHFDFTFFERMC